VQACGRTCSQLSKESGNPTCKSWNPNCHVSCDRKIFGKNDQNVPKVSAEFYHPECLAEI
jgi:hypothetical protein